MKKILVAMLLCIVFLTGCQTETGSDESRFFILSHEKGFYIGVDRTTGVEYAVSNGGYNYGTVALLVDTDGKPLIYEGEQP